MFGQIIVACPPEKQGLGVFGSQASCEGEDMEYESESHTASVSTESVLPARSLIAHAQKWSCLSKNVTTNFPVHNYLYVVVCSYLRACILSLSERLTSIIVGTLQRPYETPCPDRR